MRTGDGGSFYCPVDLSALDYWAIASRTIAPGKLHFLHPRIVDRFRHRSAFFHWNTPPPTRFATPRRCLGGWLVSAGLNA